jgi:hypothetical protein
MSLKRGVGNYLKGQLKDIKLALTPSNAKSLLKKGIAQIAPKVLQQVKKGMSSDIAEVIDVLGTTKLAKELEKKIMSGKGMRIRMDDLFDNPDRDEMEGGSIFKTLGRIAKKGVKGVGKLAKGAVKEVVKPVMRKTLKSALDIGREGLKTVPYVGYLAEGVLPSSEKITRELVGSGLGQADFKQRFMLIDTLTGQPVQTALVAPGFQEMGSYIPEEVAEAHSSSMKKRGRKSAIKGGSFLVM